MKLLGCWSQSTDGTPVFLVHELVKKKVTLDVRDPGGKPLTILGAAPCANEIAGALHGRERGLLRGLRRVRRTFPSDVEDLADSHVESRDDILPVEHVVFPAHANCP